VGGRKMNKLLPLILAGILVLSGLGASAFNITKNSIDNEEQPTPVSGQNIIFSKINVKTLEKQSTGGCSLAYIVLAIGDYDIWWNIDYTIWHNEGDHQHGMQNNIGRSISIGPLYIGFGYNRLEWDDFGAGSFEAKLLLDGTVAATSYDDDRDYDGEFEVDAGGDYKAEVDEEIQFTGTAWGGVEPYSWLWYFGDGETSTEQNPVHAYSEEGKYEVLLQVTDAEGNVSSDDAEAEIENEDEEADEFECDAGGDYEAEVGETIQFYGRAEHGYEPYSWHWDFGDGNSSTDQNPTHAYSEEGEYEVILTVTDDHGNIATDDTEAEIGED
jgi:chitodextrinase